MAGHEENEPELAVSLPEPPDAAVGSSVVGIVRGLVWSDASGLDVVSVTFQGVDIAVPVDRDAWRDTEVVQLRHSLTALGRAPRIHEGPLIGWPQVHAPTIITACGLPSLSYETTSRLDAAGMLEPSD
jgi:hypothetical protein